MGKKKLNFSIPESMHLKPKGNGDSSESPWDDEPEHVDAFDESIIKPILFYSKPEEKTNFNWMLFELALTMELYLTKRLKDKLKKYQIREQEIADFAVYIIRDNKEKVSHSVFANKEIPYFDSEMVTSFFPQIQDRRLIKQILETLCEGWSFHLESCKACTPGHCITRPTNFCPFFDLGPY